MSQVIDLCEDSDDNGEWSNTASVPSLPLSRERPREREELSNYDHPRSEKGPGHKIATGSAEFAVGLGLADEVEGLSPQKKGRGVIHGERSVKNNAALECAQLLKGRHPTENDVGSEDSGQTSRDDGSTNKHSQKLSTSWQRYSVSTWEERLIELAAYREIHGDCNVPRNSENSQLGKWVGNQKSNYRLYQDGKTSSMTVLRIQELESLGFEWGVCATPWEDRFSELVDYHKIHGHCNVPQNYSNRTKLATWVAKQRTQYRMKLEGKTTMPSSRIQLLERMGFEWVVYVTAWKDRLSELADYRQIHGHCNVPTNYDENTRLGKWVGHQRSNYRMYLKGETSSMTLSRIQALKSLEFEWGVSFAAWEDRLSELADYRRIQGHCNVPTHYTENKKLALWVGRQRQSYKLHIEGKKSQITLPRIHALERLGFIWRPSTRRGKAIPKTPSPDNDATRVRKSRKRAVEPPILPRPAHEQKDINSLSQAVLLVAGPPENDCIVATKKLAKQGAEFQLETAASNEILRTDQLAAEPLLQRHNVFTRALLLGDASTGNAVRDTPDKPANAPPNMHRTPRDVFFQSDNVLNAVEMELIWLGEESMYCLVSPEFQFGFIYEYASPVLKVELRKLSRDDQSETEKLKQIVRMDDRLVSRHFDFTRKDIRMNYF